MTFFDFHKTLGRLRCPALIARVRIVLSTVALMSAVPHMSVAADLSFSTGNANDTLAEKLRTASTVAATASGPATAEQAQEILAAALSDYRTLVQVLYDAGYFAPTVSIELNGAEAANIDLLAPPQRIDTVSITVAPGRSFSFGTARVTPLPAQTDIAVPPEFAPGAPATTGAIQAAATAGLEAWDAAGHPKAQLAKQSITANAIKARLDAVLTLAPGPKLRLGNLRLDSKNSDVSPEAIQRIAGFATGATYSPDLVSQAASRLRRTGTFSSVSIKQAETANPDGTLDFIATLEDQPPRRLTFGVEFSTSEAASLSASWMHRNLFGGAERLKIDFSLDGLGGSDQDASLSLRLDQPAAFGPDENLFYLASFDNLNEEHYSATQGIAAIGIRRTISKTSFAEAALAVAHVNADDAFGQGRKFTYLGARIRAERDTRDVKADPSRGYYLNGTATPFLGVNDSASGAQITLDARSYRALGATDRVVLAGRVQLGTVIGSGIDETAPTLLFFSGGAGSVRGQEFQSLGVPINGDTAGGRSFLGLSGEIRTKITEKISIVGFYDIGFVDSDSFLSSSSESHAGAGLGLRYDVAGIGPIRLDLAVPTSGDTNDGLQFYIGIGQAF